MKTKLGVTFEERNLWQAELEEVTIPHDWMIYNTGNLYEDSIGWYKKVFQYNKKSENRTILRFDGVYMDSTIYVNGNKAGEWKYGYSTFELDITDLLVSGSNEIVVQVVYQSPNTRWYSGAGIYRNIWWIEVPVSHITTDGIYVVNKESETGYQMSVETELCLADADSNTVFSLRYSLMDQCNEVFTNEIKLPIVNFNDFEESCRSVESNNQRNSNIIKFEANVPKPRRWDILDPYLYTLEVTLLKGEDKIAIQKEQRNIGFRTTCFDSKLGFLLNGRKVRINGVCEHHDNGALGAAFSKEAMRRKFNLLKEMGVNALRTAHNMPAPEVMELADEMGLLVVSEAFDMWECAKTEFDYSRFFIEWAHTDVKSWVCRDRNHPSLILWSIGNEIYDTHVSEHGQEITRRLMEYVREYDAGNNAPVTIGSNFMPWENARKCADIVKLAGYNYAERYYDEHHETHPDWVIYGSETSSVVQSRGIYHFPYERAKLMDEDEQCSSLGNSTTCWGAKNTEYCIYMDRDREYSCGQFIWTGFDYIGEPTPYQTKNSYFGQIDTAGFPKDSYYIFQAEWTDYKKSPMVHIFPYWDFNEGQLIDIRVASNAPKIELFVNGKSVGVKQIDHKKGHDLLGHFQVPYVHGEIMAVAYDENNQEIARESRKSFGDTVKLCLKSEKNQILANGEDLVYVEITAEDEHGTPVENASDYVEVELVGVGRLVGLDNGDSTDYDQYKGTIRKFFNGKLIAIIAADTNPGEIKVIVRDARLSEHAKKINKIIANNSESIENTKDTAVILKSAELKITAIEAEVREGISVNATNKFQPLSKVEVGFVPVRKIELMSKQGQCLHPDCKQIEVEAICYPKDATDKELIWNAVNSSGMTTNLASIEVKDNKAVITAIGDGSFYIRCMSKNGTDKVKLISQLEMSVENFGAACIDPYDFVAGGLYSLSNGEVGSAEDNGIATDKEGETQIGFQGLDFGDYGSDEVTISIFANSSEAYDIQIWEGMPEQAESNLLYKGIYQKPSEWQVFKPETYKLNKRLKGISTVCIVTKQSMTIKGFQFTKIQKAFALLETKDNGTIYGDSFRITQEAVEGIGNNVSIEFEDMDFGEKGAQSITICGRTSLPNNTIHVRFFGEENSNQIVEFPQEEEYTAHTFPLTNVYGKQKVSFIFLPGSNFDFKWFQFE